MMDRNAGGCSARSQSQNDPQQREVLMHRHRLGVGALALAALISVSSGASAQLALSANDGKAVLIDGVNSVPASPTADTVAVIDLNATPPKVIAEIPAPTSVVGPPSSVAIAPDESFALVTGASKVDPADPKKTVPDDKLTVIDLKASPPKVSAQLQAGKGAAGVSINLTGSYQAAFVNGLIWNGINVAIMLWLLAKGRVGTRRGHKMGRQPFPATP
jgi:hypothetical protein